MDAMRLDHSFTVTRDAPRVRTSVEQIGTHGEPLPDRYRWTESYAPADRSTLPVGRPRLTETSIERTETVGLEGRQVTCKIAATLVGPCGAPLQKIACTTTGPASVVRPSVQRAAPPQDRKVEITAHEAGFLMIHDTTDNIGEMSVRLADERKQMAAPPLTFEGNMIYHIEGDRKFFLVHDGERPTMFKDASRSELSPLEKMEFADFIVRGLMSRNDVPADKTRTILGDLSEALADSAQVAR